MLFIEIQFWQFYSIVYLCFVINAYYIKKVPLQNLLIITASYYFYAQWDWRFLSLVILSSLTDYLCGLGLKNKRTKAFVYISLFINLSILGVFKYLDFFIAQADEMLSAIGFNVGYESLAIVLPIGISFYTFQTISYTIDVYKEDINPTTDIVKFFAFVSFFPQLVAGPIERAGSFLQQFDNLYIFNSRKTIQGLRLILVGLFLKICVADNLAQYVDLIWSDANVYNGGVLLLGTIYFSFQIYCDFCGYSTIAIGLALVLGFELRTNFITPYFATNIKDFWRRWHISLSTFFRDYVYIPLGGSKNNNQIRNLYITFLLSGMWHGASWMFLIWGAYHGTLLVLQNYFESKISKTISLLPDSLSRILGIFATFILVCIGWVFFRSESVEQALLIFGKLTMHLDFPTELRFGLVYVLIAMFIDFLWKDNVRLESMNNLLALPVFRWVFYSFLFWMLVFNFKQNASNQFIYFQF